MIVCPQCKEPKGLDRFCKLNTGKRGFICMACKYAEQPVIQEAKQYQDYLKEYKNGKK